MTEVINTAELTKAVSNMLLYDMPRCVDSYLSGTCAKTANDLVAAAFFFERAIIKPFVETGQLYLTPEWRMRQTHLSRHEKELLIQTKYSNKMYIEVPTLKKVNHDLEQRMGLSMRLAFRCLYNREVKNCANSTQT